VKTGNEATSKLVNPESSPVDTRSQLPWRENSKEDPEANLHSKLEHVCKWECTAIIVLAPDPATGQRGTIMYIHGYHIYSYK